MSELKSTAPYNFVRLNKVVLQPPLADAMNNLQAANTNEAHEQIKAKYKEYVLKGEKFSGYFDVEVVNKSPLYIGDTLNGKSSFFSDGKNYCIPGSSMRGCLKNIFKIITNGSMRIGVDGDVDNQTLYYRSFASSHDEFNEEYKREMSITNSNNNKKGVYKYSAKPGFLVKQGNSFYVCPAECEVKRVTVEKANIYGKPYFDWNSDKVTVYTGAIDGKKNIYIIKKPSWNIKYVVSENCLLKYLNDKNRNGINLIGLNELTTNIDNGYARKGNDSLAILKGAQLYDYIIPCFYVENRGMVKHFGSGPLYRIPYRKSIGDHIPSGLKEDKVDFADAIFGNKELWGSRVFFEDLYIKARNGTSVTYPEADAEPMLGPKPTSFQNYLMTDEEGKSQHWNSSAELRGYKLYWHKKCQWKDSRENRENMDVIKTIAPMKEENHFYGRLRFENLDAVELGALAKVFAIGEGSNTCFKLGMGKALGMGSVKIVGKLHLRTKDYFASFLSKGIEETSYNRFVEIFDSYVCTKLSENEYKLYQERMYELQLIMDYSLKNAADWEERTEYISINDENKKKLVTDRKPLPLIEDVVGKKK